MMTARHKSKRSHGALEPLREVTVTLCFTDIEQSSGLAQAMGNRRWARLMQWHNDTIGAIVESHGGHVVKTLGDGTMIAFEATQPAAHAAIEIQRAMIARREPPVIRLRVGIHIGDVIETGGDYIGHAVNKAARIAAAARGGQIMVSDAFSTMLSEAPECLLGDIEVVKLKGLDGVHQVAPLLYDAEGSSLSLVSRRGSSGP